MYKGRSASYQRGMGKSDYGPITAADLAKFTKTKISKEELNHFSFGSRTREVVLTEVEPLVRGYAKNGFKTPKDVARLLNKANVKTACGEQWTPQLAWFLLGFLFERREKRRAEIAKPKPSAPKTTPVPDTRGPLTAEEMMRRLSALGRVVGSR